MKPAFVTLALCFALSACGGDDGESTDCDFALMVDVDTTPTYSFDTSVSRVSVIRDDDRSTVVWGVFANPPGDNIASPVEHGVVPPNASLQTQEEVTLSTGVFYTVIVARDSGATCEESFVP